MKTIKACFSVLSLTILTSTATWAQASRTWVSGVGDDANPCSRTAPCKTFAGAISKTAAGGEIDALDPGGFGAVTITKAITLDGGEVGVTSVLVSGTNGIVVQAGANDVVTIRNLSINGIGSGLNGIRFLSGKALHVERCVISNFTTRGIDIATAALAQVFVIDTICRDNGESGLRAVATARVFVTIDRSRFENNTSFGVFGGNFSRFTVTDSDASGNGTGFVAQATAADVVMNISSSRAASNSAAGVQAGGSTNLSVLRLTNVFIVSNAVDGMVIGTNGSIVSFGDNQNSGTGAPSSNIMPQ